MNINYNSNNNSNNSINNLDLTSFETYKDSVLIKIKEILLDNFEDLNKLELKEIKDKEKEINIYSNFNHIEPISKEEIIILDEDKIDIKNAETAILNGEIFWEHTAAGEATRLGLGTKYLLNLSEFKIKDFVSQMLKEEENEINKLNLSGSEKDLLITKLNEKITPEFVSKIIGSENYNLKNLSLGNRHMLQLAFDIKKLSDKHNLNYLEVLKKQKNLIILNEETSDKIIQEFINFNFFGFSQENTYFMIQKKFHGIKLENGELIFDESTNNNKRLHNHGQMFMQKNHNNVIFKIKDNQINQKIKLTSEKFQELLSKHLNLLSYNIEDLTYLNSSIDYPSLSLALDLGRQDFGMIMEIVANNPIKPQKGGACFFDKILNKVVMIESNQLGNIKNEEIVHLNKNFNHYPNPSQIFQKVKENGLNLSFEIKKAKDENNNTKEYIYPCPVQGDSNFLTKTAFVMRKNIKPISAWKSASTTPIAVNAKIKQDNQIGFKEFVETIKNLNN